MGRKELEKKKKSMQKQKEKRNTWSQKTASAEILGLRNAESKAKAPNISYIIYISRLGRLGCWGGSTFDIETGLVRLDLRRQRRRLHHQRQPTGRAQYYCNCMDVCMYGCTVCTYSSSLVRT